MCTESWSERLIYVRFLWIRQFARCAYYKLRRSPSTLFAVSVWRQSTLLIKFEVVFLFIFPKTQSLAIWVTIVLVSIVSKRFNLNLHCFIVFTKEKNLINVFGPECVLCEEFCWIAKVGLIISFETEHFELKRHLVRDWTMFFFCSSQLRSQMYERSCT